MPRKQVRYAVVGLGHIAQVAVLPAFGNARRNSRLAALVSGDPVKLEELGAKYHVDPRYSYERYDEMLKSGEVDAVYIATPNSLHAEYAIRAAQAGLHVLVEKPMAVTEEQCERMAEAARTAGVKLMVAYRLHFERANLEAIEVARSGRIGEPRIFTSTFTMQVVLGNIRLQHVIERFASSPGGLDEDLELAADLFLPDVLRQRRRAERALDLLFLSLGRLGGNQPVGFDCHVRILPEPSRRRGCPRSRPGPVAGP